MKTQGRPCLLFAAFDAAAGAACCVLLPAEVAGLADGAPDPDGDAEEPVGLPLDPPLLNDDALPLPELSDEPPVPLPLLVGAAEFAWPDPEAGGGARKPPELAGVAAPLETLYEALASLLVHTTSKPSDSRT